MLKTRSVGVKYLFHPCTAIFRSTMSGEDLISVDYEVFGRVQGVFFRKYTQAEGKKLGLVGWVQNTGAGTVQGQLQGSSSKKKKGGLNNLKRYNLCSLRIETGGLQRLRRAYTQPLLLLLSKPVLIINTMIKCLPADVQGKLRSGVAVPSLQQCVEELMLNSIDAGATCVGVRMDMDALKVQVIDNGAGINAEDMENLGNRYYTSKCSSLEDLENLRWYGFRGEALASVVSLASLVEISSRTRSSVKTHVKLFKDGKSMGVFESETARPSAGITVIVCSFFHNMPVRRKRMDAVLEGERIRHRVEAISLMHPSVSFTLKNDCTGAMMVQLSKANNTYHRFLQIHGLGKAQKLGEISHTHAQFEVTGYSGREGHYNNSLQFLYVNERLLLRTRIHKLLNCLLRRLSSSSQKNDSPDGQSAIRSPKHKRSQEQHGVYIINIKCPYSEYDICLEPAKTLIEFRDWDGILLCIEEAVKAFLSKENLVAELSQDDLDSFSPKLFGTHNTDQEGHHRSDWHQESSSTSTLDCNIGMKLASDSVHRKCKDDGVFEDKVTMEGTEETEEKRQRKITTNEMAKNISNQNKECKDKPQCHMDRLKPESESKTTEGKMLTAAEAGEGSHILCTLSEIGQLGEEKLNGEIQLRYPTSTDDTILKPSIPQQIQPDLNIPEKILPDFESTKGHGLTSKRDGKITICDPYIQESLQTEGPLKKKSGLNSLVRKLEDRSLVSKRKISLDVSHDRTFQKQCRDFVPIIPPKVPRILKGQKISLCMESGSLEKFRRMYSKPPELKKTFQETQLDNSAALLEASSSVFNSQNLLCSQKEEQDSDTQKEVPQSPPELSVFSKLKPPSEENTSKTSLAAKLCRLKDQRGDDSKALPNPLRTVSLGNNESIQGSNNSDSACDPEPTLDCSTVLPLAEREEALTSGDWLHHYDTSVGKIVYINKVTGLSRYEDPHTEEIQVGCTSDVTNMAVSVISETEDNGENSNSLTSLYSKWNNPVFVRPPMVGMDISSRQAETLAVKVHNILFPYRFSKDMIHSMKVIHQVDKKFLACLINTREEKSSTPAETEGNLLVLVDQHAAHERVRLENLVADSYEDDPDAPGERRLCSSSIFPPLEISVTEEELRLLRSRQLQLRSLGLEVTFSEAVDPHVFVGKVPVCFLEKESNELRRGRPSVIKPTVKEYLREQIELLCSTGRVRGTLPLTVLKVLASLACHGAIKFNDSLSKDECCSLVASLSSCQLPFQCAHGRPSIAPLIDILHLDKEQEAIQKPNLRKLRRMYKAWQLYGDK
ncbi:DNA mismatch repair protein Mlh3 isoform X2 [Xyrichtys novacula]|uniref:acylphosphatase n=1 Tax=Xyrichtys novacula TaxID=13765 RepID=A0AAV1GLT7_XYRNO|nr:DNA mismatch repair protein Mlh3 isoform X2 [Xyrichtys novacula]